MTPDDLTHISPVTVPVTDAIYVVLIPLIKLMSNPIIQLPHRHISPNVFYPCFSIFR
jgi:hypothetical protein